MRAQDKHKQKHKQRQQLRRLSEFVAVAVLIHLALVPVFAWLIPTPEPFPKRKTALRVITVPSSKLASRHRVKNRPTPEVEKKKPKEEKVKPEELAGQVVDVPPSPDDEVPEEADFLSEHNTRTERESRSRHQAKDYKNAMNELTRASQNIPATPQPAKQTSAVEIGPDEPKKARRDAGVGQEPAFELPELRQRDRLALKIDPELGRFRNQRDVERLPGNSKRLKLSAGDDEKDPSEASKAPRQAPTMADLVPDVGVLARLQGAPSNDHLEDIEEGEGTFLNSREFKYASFFNRMKRGVSQHWRPLDEYRRRDPSGNIYGQRARVTVLTVTLTRDGSLKTVAVRHSSGVDFLDREAVQAFHRAGPFPNPPSGLIDTAGQITFPFGFHVEFSRHGGLRLPF